MAGHCREGNTQVGQVLEEFRGEIVDRLDSRVWQQGTRPVREQVSGDLIWLVGLLGKIALASRPNFDPSIVDRPAGELPLGRSCRPRPFAV
jgi:hypothetical protein